ncbi:MAG: transglycosylase SLT domain-containing protein [Vulcanimicrobiaceae bacterium]
MSSINSLIGAASDLAARGVAFAPAIAQAASRHGLDPRLLAAVAAQETGGPGANAGRNIVGDGGHGHGLFQIDDRWHSFASTAAAMDPARNAEYAAGMLSGLISRYGGNIRKALSAYNAGSPNATGTVTTWRDGKALGYADSVLRHYTALGTGDTQALTEELLAERQSEQSNVNSLMGLAQQIPSYCPVQTPSHSYRQLAGLDANGAAQGGPDFGSLVDASDAGSDS